MFTGIVEEIGAVAAVQDQPATRLTVYGPTVTTDATTGSSLAVDGVCLTAATIDRPAGLITADLMPETTARSTLGALRPGDPVNLERAATPASRLGGHLVQGHIDGVGWVLSRTVLGHSMTVHIGLPPELKRYLVAQGSIAVDGVSLTIAELTGKPAFTVGLVPATLRATTLGEKRVGDPVNLEVDVLAKYVERLLAQAG
jgi:riboflavin synthase